MYYSQIKKRTKVLITTTMVTALLASPLLPSASLIVQANQKDSSSESIELEHYSDFIFEHDYLEVRDDKIILEEVRRDDSSTLVRYKSINEDGYVEIEEQSMIVFKKVAIST